MKKLLITAAALFAIITLTTCQTLMAAFQEPSVSLHSVELGNISIDGAQIICKVQVENPNSFGIAFPETDWEFFINANSFLRGTIKNDQQIRSRDTSIVDVPLSINYLDLINTFTSLRGSRETAFKVALGVKFNLPIVGSKTWNFEHEGSLPMPQLPKFSAPTMSIASRDLTRAEIQVAINVENPNVFPIPAPKISYDYQVNRNSFIRGDAGGEGNLAANTTTPVVFRLIVTYADLLRSFASLITAREVASLLVMTCDFGIPLLGEPSRFEVSGTLPLR